MRVGLNLAKFTTEFQRLAPVTVTMTTHVPFQSGYYEHAFEVLRLCLASLRAHTQSAYDLMVLDNASCPEVVDYLRGLQAAGDIQFLLLSRTNIGYNAAVSLLLSAAPGEYVAHTDSDAYFSPGWLEEEMRIMQAFDNVGMVSGMPAMHCFGLHTAHTLERAAADPETQVERGQFTPDEWIVDWGISLGRDPAEFLPLCRGLEQVRLTRRGVTAFAVSTHFQFLARTAVVREFAPFPPVRAAMQSNMPYFDEPMDKAGYLRLATARPVVHHLGNVLTPRWQEEARRLGLPVAGRSLPPRASLLRRLLRTRVLRRATFELYQLVSRLMSYVTA